MQHNPARGEIVAHFGGRSWRLCLTLGALAELEDMLNIPDLSALASRFADGRISARDLIALITAGLHGGGHAVSQEDVARMAHAHGLAGFVSVAARLLDATFPESPNLDAGPAARKSEPEDEKEEGRAGRVTAEERS